MHRADGCILRGITTLLPFITWPSRIVSSSRKYQYGCTVGAGCGKSCMLSGQPVMMKSDNSANAGSTFVSSCRDSKQTGSTFGTCAMLMSRPGIALVGFVSRTKASEMTATTTE